MKNVEAFVNPYDRRSFHSQLAINYPSSSLATSNGISESMMTYSSPSDHIRDGVLSGEDIMIGALLAVSLAFLFSFLQGRSPSSSNIILWRNQSQEEKIMNEKYMENANEKIFDGESWKEISKPENYEVYSQGQSDLDGKENHSENTTFKPMEEKGKIENKLVLIALLCLFVPIFSVEFFFALSRQFICGDYLTSVDDSMWIMDAKKAALASSGSSPWAAKLCSPANMAQ